MSSILAVSLLGGCRASDKPVTLTVWTYYNGDQLASFERLVEEFNTTIGKKEHITVEASSQGSINDLEKNVLDAAKGRVGALAMPNIFSAYAHKCNLDRQCIEKCFQLWNCHMTTT